MVKRAFELISDIPTKLICFSDDLDGMRARTQPVVDQWIEKDALIRSFVEQVRSAQ